MASHIGRRKFLATLGGAAVGWPIAGRAEQPGKLPTIGFLGANPSIESHRVAAFVQRLRELDPAIAVALGLPPPDQWLQALAEVRETIFRLTRAAI
jgi:hypothetical protein